MKDTKLNSEQFKNKLKKNPFIHAGYRGIIRKYNDDMPIPEQDNVPFVTSALFPILFIFYLLYAWMKGVMIKNNVIDKEYTHLISITSTTNYRTYPMTAVADELQLRGEDVLLICSPSAEDDLEHWNEVAPSVTFKQLHTNLQLKQIYSIIFNSIRTTYELWNIIKCDDISPCEVKLAFNLTLLEYLEHYSLANLTNKDTHYHSMKITSYMISGVSLNQAYVYQHGIMIGGNDKSTETEYPGIQSDNSFVFSRNFNSYYPLTYFVWGDKFRSMYENVVHPESCVIATGSPWFDHLTTQSKAEDDKDVDVLFISQSYGYKNNSEYELLVKKLVSICNECNLKLAIKLHPRESIQYYLERNLEHFVDEFNDIDDALKNSKMAVTDTSSAFLEASVLNTPIVVTDIGKSGLHRWSSTNNVSFLSDISELKSEILMILNNETGNNQTKKLIHTGNSTSKICDVINK